MIYTVTLNPAVDYLVYLPALSVGEIQRSTREAFYFSGKGINVSKVLLTLGMESVALGFLAGFTGRAIADALTEEGIRHDFCFLPKGSTRVNVKIRHGAETDLNCQGPDIPEEPFAMLVEKLSRLSDGDVLILSGSVPKTLRKDAYAQMMQSVSGKGIRTVVDADGELLLNSLSERPYLVKPNREELSAVLQKPLLSDDALIEGARELQKRGARNVLVSLGGDGAMYCTESGEVYRIGAAQGDCVNSIGAGDSMLAGFVAGLCTGDPVYALRLGSAAGAATAFAEGMATKEEIDRIFRSLPNPERL